MTKGVEDALKDLRPGLPGVTIDSTIFRPASFVEIAIHNLKTALLIGCLLVILVLIAFLFEWRAAFISLVAIPLSLVAAGVVLTLRGATINTMILAGFAVAVGVVVDDAIIDMENIVRRMRLRAAAGTPEPLMRTILKASLEVRGAIFYATLINVVAVVPVLFVGGLTGVVLPAARPLLRARRARLDARRADGDPGAEPDPALARAAPAPGTARSCAGSSAATAGSLVARDRAGPPPRIPPSPPSC